MDHVMSKYACLIEPAYDLPERSSMMLGYAQGLRTNCLFGTLTIYQEICVGIMGPSK
jgi:hypothetical protein